MDVIEMKDVEGRTVRVDEGDVLAAIANRMLDDERIYFARTTDPRRYFCLRLCTSTRAAGRDAPERGRLALEQPGRTVTP